MSAVAAPAWLDTTAPRLVAPAYRPRDARVRRALASADLVAVAVAFQLVLAPTEGWWGLLALALWPLLFKGYGLYEADIRRLTRGTLRDLPGVVHATLVGAALTWLYADLTPAAAPDAATLLTFAAAAALGTLALRALVRRALRRLLGAERALIVGDAASIPVLERKLRDHPEYGVEVVRVAGGDAPLDLASAAAGDRVDRLIVAGADPSDGSLGERVRAAHALGLKVDFLPHPREVIGAAVEVDDIEGLTVYSLYPPVLCRSSRWLKRGMDIAGAAVLLILTAPVMAVVAVAVKLDSGGPVLFRQRRVGRGGRPLTVTKFRTMVVGAERRSDELRRFSSDPHWLLLDRDPRVTRVGRLLRVHSLDELPQLWSVLKGDMSLVGPRPLVEHEDRQITGWRRGRLDLRPGLTGLWQVLGRACIPFEEMVKLDYLYVTNWSAWRDVQLLLRTLGVLRSGRGAN
ncbi:MAG TPA: exopolysaccharide biosynthesis polyprenyl glycosylphosphotransferase [Solirubrobacteraceae bacterium]|jgi:exopolysaccharide biosynthesis polyprenyl glycosylphosphotransferase